MSRIVFTSDLQAHNHEAYAQITGYGRNTRLQTALDCLYQAAELAERGILVINGDLFHHRTHLAIDVHDAVVDTICEIARDVEVVLNVGNHDQFLRDGRVHSLRGLEDRPNITVVPLRGWTMGWGFHKGVRLHVFPFTTQLNLIREFISDAAMQARRQDSQQLLVLHAPVQTALLGGNRRAETGLVEEDFPDCFDAVLLGHFHKPQALFGRPIFYIGSPYQVDWTEAEDKKRFIVWEEGNLRSVPVVGMPEFKRLGLSDFESLKESDPEAAARDFIELEVEDLEQAEKLALPPNVLPVRPAVEVKNAPTVVLDNFSTEEAVSQWLKARGRDDLLDLAKERMNG